KNFVKSLVFKSMLESCWANTFIWVGPPGDSVESEGTFASPGSAVSLLCEQAASSRMMSNMKADKPAILFFNLILSLSAARPDAQILMDCRYELGATPITRLNALRKECELLYPTRAAISSTVQAFVLSKAVASSIRIISK